MAKLTKEMQECLELAKLDGALIRCPGGYWTTAGTVINEKTHIPEGKYFGTLTINALIARGLIRGTYFFKGTARPYQVEVSEAKDV